MVIQEASDPVKTQETVEVSMSNDSSASAVPPSTSVEVPAQVPVGEKVECSSSMYKLEKGFVTDVGQNPVSNNRNSASSKFSLAKPVQERFMLPMNQPHQRRGQIP